MTRKKLVIPLFLILTIVGLSWFIWHKQSSPSNSADNNNEPILAEAINGIKVEPEVAKKRPIAVIVENHPDSRPQSGLTEADIVYETLAEGGITRYMALYQTKDATNIGPVRSLRIYFGELADQWRSVLAHVGGNSEALNRLKRGEYKNASDADEYFNGKYFKRVSSRPAPHNVYTSIDLLKQLMNDRDYSDQASYTSWKFKDDTANPTPQATVITIPFSTPSFTASYQYDPATNTYLRFLAKLADRDANNKQQLAVKNVLIQFAPAVELPTDAIGTISFNLKTGGKVVLFQDGNVTAGTWKRADGTTRYYDATGQELAFNRGQTWVAIVPTDLEANVTWH